MLGLAVMMLLIAAQGPGVTVEVSAGPHDRGDVPVYLELPDGLKSTRYLKLERADTGATVPVQVVGDPPRACWVLDGPLAAGSTRRYRLTEDQGPSERAIRGNELT